ncbi:PREDICTED: mitogen-activated protein kinase kinase kinase 9-like isoform X2 [Camelina sativa]|uniref:Mitogen-activated protein kinase kinase kinase 9-like isoform X2 n=1 Tax=Camelina sativa TaxID=90675 RepID=A0ABM0T6U7_CAMSA|nr:PREDICTED: mitogen-activated protein kinase kinase kinase 9-like isoform X2 [Camelina sativa]
MKESSDKSPVRRHDTAKHNNSEAVSSSSSFTDTDSTCSLVTPSMEFPDRISFREMDLGEAGPSGVVLASSSTNRDVAELTRSESGDFTELLMPSESNEVGSLSTPARKLVPNEEIPLSPSSLMDRIVALMKKSSGRRGDKTSPGGKLKRSVAAKNIKYDAAEDPSLLTTRSLDFLNRTSFRVVGNDEGEMDRICNYFGVSRSEDFAISSDAWEARKKRSSSDVTNGFKSLDLDSNKVQAQDLSEPGPTGVVLDASNSMNLDITKLTPYDSRDIAVAGCGGLKGVRPPVLNLPPADNRVVDGGKVANRRGIGGGIKGVRPSVLKPPPVMKLPPLDLAGSSWDFLTHFAPESSTVRRPSSSSSSSENGCDEEEVRGDISIELEDRTDEACSFTTNECDSSSTVSNTSPIFVSGGPINTSWQKGQLMRQGSFGSVYEAISEDGDFFAVKEVSLLNQGSQAQECIQQVEEEIALLSQLQHQNIVRYRGSTKEGSNLYIFLELVSQGSLLKLYERYQLRDSVVSLYTRQILDGLRYLHDKGLVHRDIKCANILVDANGAVKLADFGLAKVINPKGNDVYGSPADIWSLGCTVLEMCTGQIPYSDLQPVQAHIRIEMGTLPDIPDTLSLDAQDFIVTCLKVNPEERPTAAELLNHPFVRRPLLSSGSGGSVSPLIRR